MIGYLVAMMALGRIFNGGFAEILIIELNTLILFGIFMLNNRLRVNKIITSFVSMFLISVVAMLFYYLKFIDNFFLVVITNAFFMIPGIQMINCARNFLCANEMNGIIEFLKVVLEVCTIVAGVAAAYAILGSVVGNPLLEESIVAMKITWLSAIELVVLSFLASAGFSVVFNIEIKEVIYAAIGGAIVRIFYLLFQFVFPTYRFLYITLAAFFAALYSEILAVNRKEPSTLFLYPSIIPLIPGDLVYYVSLGLVWSNADLLAYGPDLAFSLIGISFGFVLCSAFVHYIRKVKFLRIKN